MKWKKIGNFAGMALGTVYMFAVLYLKAVNKVDRGSLPILFLFFLVWGITVFANLAAFFDNKEINIFGLKIASTKEIKDSNFPEKRLESLDKQMGELEKQISSLSKQVAKLRFKDIQNNFVSLNSASKANQLSAGKPNYETPKILNDLIELRKEAKTIEYDYAYDQNYKELFAHISNEVLSNLGIAINMQMQWHQTDKLLKLDIEEDIHQAFDGKKINFMVIDAIQKRVEEVDHDPQISITFSKAIDDLKRLQ